MRKLKWQEMPVSPCAGALPGRVHGPHSEDFHVEDCAKYAFINGASFLEIGAKIAIRY